MVGFFGRIGVMKVKINAWAVKKPKARFEKFVYEKNIEEQEVLVAVKYCGLSRGDVCFVDNFWGDTSYPLIPGVEIFGVIKKKGKKVKGFKINDFVGMGYQMSSCLKCEHCREGKEQFCKKQKVISVNGYGGLADGIVFDSRFVFKIPPDLRTPSDVPLMCSGLTVYSAIKKANVKTGMKVGVAGVGNLGHLAVQILNKIGCEVTAFSHTKKKEAILRKLGAEYFVNSIDKKSLKEAKGKYDVILSTSSVSLNWPAYIEALKPQGNLCIVGLPEKDISFPPVLLADYAQRGVLGSYVGSRSEMKELLNFVSKNHLKAITEVFPIAEVNAVVSKIRNKSIPFSVVVKTGR